MSDNATVVGLMDLGAANGSRNDQGKAIVQYWIFGGLHK